MPEQSKGKRGSGSWVGTPAVGHVKMSSQRCSVCTFLLAQSTVDEGKDTHPSCDLPQARERYR